MKQFLPISRADMQAQGMDQLDFVYVIGDAYVDHPSFGHAIISRILQANGFSVGIISQPDWKNPDSISILGEPKIGFIVTGGNMDSMVNHYSVSKKRRQKDAFTPGGIMGRRPDYATVVYCNLIRRTYKHTPLIIGGLEASLRRLGHYDYWSNKVKRSILLDSGADLLLYGMGERSIVAVAEGLRSGIDIKDLTYIDGTVYKTKDPDSVYDGIMLPSYEEICASKESYAHSFYTQYCNTDPFTAKRLIEPYPNKCYVVQNPPSKPLTTSEMDAVYALPYMRTYHPSYEEAGGVPAIEEVKFSLVSNRGCYGGCSFCALTFHQGRIIQTRSHESILNEAKQMVWEPDFKGYIHDVGGPTADFRQPSCQKQLTKGVCKNKQCLFPTPCKNLIADHSDYLALLRKLRKIPKVKKVFIRSGIRFDYVLEDTKSHFLQELADYHVSGQLRVAPEHVADKVLEKMGKPSHKVYLEFLKQYYACCKKSGKEQYAVPYFMSSHPGCGLKEAVELAEYIRDMGFMPEQVQDFYPTPSTISTCMYYTGLDPRTMEKVYVPVNPHEKNMQRALIQYRRPENRKLVEEALVRAGRQDLIGFGPKCLIRPYDGRRTQKAENLKTQKGHIGNNGKNGRGNQNQQSNGRQQKQHMGKKKTIRNVHKKR